MIHVSEFGDPVWLLDDGDRATYHRVPDTVRPGGGVITSDEGGVITGDRGGSSPVTGGDCHR